MGTVVDGSVCEGVSGTNMGKGWLGQTGMSLEYEVKEFKLLSGHEE